MRPARRLEPSVNRSRRRLPAALAGLLGLAGLAGLLLAGPSARAADEAAPDAAAAEPGLDDDRPVRASLVADVERAGLGTEFHVALRLELAAGWHVYWTYPGNTGKPTRVQFSSDEDHTKVLEPRFPLPQVFDADTPELMSFGYSGELLVPAPAMVYAPPPAGRTTITAEVRWLACKRSCVSGRARPQLELAAGEQPRPSPWAERLAELQPRLPQPLPAEAAHLESLHYDSGRFRLRFRLPGVAAPADFVPSWIEGGACRIESARVLDPPEAPAALELVLAGQQCLPGVGGVLRGRTAAAPPQAAPRALQVQAWAPPAAAAEPAAAGRPPAAADAAAATEQPGPPAQRESLWMMLLLALLGGMLLNIMPCVIPVVVPKLLHVVRTAQQADDPAERRRLLWTNALAYTGGVLATLLSLAVLVLVLKHIGHRVGWGFQFQNPWFLVFMIGLLLVLGLGMLHVFPLQSSRHADDMKQLRRTRRRSPLLESFLTGLLVTFLGTPCTAPALGPALGYAFTAGDVEIVLLLAVVGLGLASPFLLIGAWTGWTRVLPRRVTERYDRIMRGMAFLLFGTAVWLLDVLAEGYGSRAALATVWFCLALAAAAWLFGLISDASERWRRRLLKLLPLVLAVGLFGCWVLDFSAPQAGRPLRLQSEVGIRWQPFSEQRLAELRRAGKTVFIDFTAEWCMNCKANEELFIETEATRELIEQLDVAAVMADHTRHDPVIQTWLERYGRAGVPMYLIFPACARNDQAILLPEILTSERLHAALKKAGPSRGGCPAAPPL